MPDPDTSFSDREFIKQELKKQNKSLYLCSLYFDEDKQPSAQAVFSLFLELKKIPSTISEPMLGEIRTTWWREMIETGDPDKAGAPLGRQILEGIEKFNLSKGLFYELLEGITQDFYLQTYAEQQKLEDFFDKTYGSFFSIFFQLCSGKLQSAPQKPVKSAGRALGYAISLYETPIALQRNQHYFPEDLLIELDINSQDIFERKYDAALTPLYKEMEKLSLESLKITNKELTKLPTANKPGFTPLAQINPLLKMIKKTDNPLTQITPLSPLGFQWHLWKCAKRGQF